jgi:homeobox-leucine zipper protein
MFSCIIAKSSTMEEISTGVAGSRDGALLLVSVEQHYPVSICTSYS